MRPKLSVVFGLGYGDEGKGTIVDFLSRRSPRSLIVRYNGGSQAGHNVITPKGVWHCFAQFGAGSFVPGTETYLSSRMVVDLETLHVEAGVLQSKNVRNVLARLTIDPGAAVVTPMQKMVGQMLELSRGSNRYGSCGQGIGQTISDQARGLSLTMDDCRHPHRLRHKLEELQEAKFDQAATLLANHTTPEMTERFKYFLDRSDLELLLPQYRRLAAQIRIAPHVLRQAWANGRPLIFEGAQGALLDQLHGFVPHVTQGRATFHNVESLLGIPLADESLRSRYTIEKIGVMRAFGHRHGAGPFVTEDPTMSELLTDPRNRTNPWQGEFRVGWIDLVALRYGLAINGGADGIALTNLDWLDGISPIRLCTSYTYRGDLASLDPYFVWTKLGEKMARISDLRFRTTPSEPPDAVTTLLGRCTPDYTELPGWPGSVRGVTNHHEFPAPAKDLLEAISGPVGLATPIHYISVGPTANDKLHLSTVTTR